MLVVAYLAAIAAANISATLFGPASLPLNALLFIGFDLTARDRLHEKWGGSRLKLGALVLGGALISLVLCPGSARVSAASALSFLAAGLVDTAVFSRTKSVNGSNAASSLVDSLLFQPLAFGALDPTVAAGQFLAKVAGGALAAMALKRVRHG